VLVAAAFLPHPPALVPELAAGVASELAGVREACVAALQRVLEANADLVIVVGDDRVRSTYAAGAAGSFEGFGVPVAVSLPGSDVAGAGADLPLSLAVAAWLMESAGPWPLVRGEGVPATTSSSDAGALGARWAHSAARVAMIAMGDGAATLTVKAPGYLVEGAAQWQKGVAQALADADVVALAAIEPRDAHTFRAAGRVAWQVVAGATGESADDQLAQSDGGQWVGEMLADEAPYGVASPVALWQRASA
jgi:hypothetical protein